MSWRWELAQSDTEILVLGAEYWAGLPLPAFPSYLTEYPWDTLKWQRCLIPGPRDAGLSHTRSTRNSWCAPARCDWCRAPGSTAQPAEAPWAVVWVQLLTAFWKNTCAFPTLCNLLLKTQPSVACIFFLMSMLMNSWQISDSYFHSFTFTRGNIPPYFKKRKWRWTIFENLAPKCYAFHLTFPELFAGGRLESSLKPGPQLGCTKTFRIYSFYIIHLFRALLHFTITWSSQFSSQIGFGDKMLEQVREYYFKLNIFSIEWLWLL